MFQDSGGFSSGYDTGMRMGGAFELKQVTWAQRHATISSEAAADVVPAKALRGVGVAGWFGAMPWRPGCSPLRHLPAYEDFRSKAAVARSGRSVGFLDMAVSVAH